MSVTGYGNWNVRVINTTSYTTAQINCRPNAAIPLNGIIPYFDGAGDVLGDITSSARGVFQVSLDYPDSGLGAGTFSFQLVGGSIDSNGNTADYSVIPGSNVNCVADVGTIVPNTATGIVEPYIAVVSSNVAAGTFVFIFHPMAISSGNPIGGSFARCYNIDPQPAAGLIWNLTISVLEPEPTAYDGYSIVHSS